MKMRLESAGTGLALRIPKQLAEDAQLKPNSLVEVTLVDGKLVVVPLGQPKYTLKELVAGITKKNRHSEIQTGPATGKEIW